MIGKQIVALTLLSAMADQALAAPGHQHRQLHAVEKKRALEIEVVTEIVTVTVTYGAEPTKDDKGGIFVSVPDTTSTSVAAAPTVEQQVDNQKPASSSSSAQVQENAKRPSTSTSTSTSTAAVTTTAQPTTTAEPTTTAQPTTTAVPSSSSSTSSAAPASTSASSGGSGGSKRGIAYNDGTLASKLEGSCSWAYNWETQAKGGPSAKYIPTLKDASTQWITWFNDQVANGDSLTSSSLNTVFSANEPDNGGQAGGTITSVAAAVQFQVTHFSKNSNDVSSVIKAAQVGAPSVTNGQGANQGLNYLKQWVEACKTTDGCRYDFCNLHWYDKMDAEDTLFSNLEKAHEICGTPVWLTEFAAIDENEAEIAAWLPGVLSKLDALDYVPRYAYFMAGSAQKVGWNLFNSDGSLNAIGKAYTGTA